MPRPRYSKCVGRLSGRITLFIHNAAGLRTVFLFIPLSIKIILFDIEHGAPDRDFSIPLQNGVIGTPDILSFSAVLLLVSAQHEKVKDSGERSQR